MRPSLPSVGNRRRIFNEGVRAVLEGTSTHETSSALCIRIVKPSQAVGKRCSASSRSGTLVARVGRQGGNGCMSPTRRDVNVLTGLQCLFVRCCRKPTVLVGAVNGKRIR